MLFTDQDGGVNKRHGQEYIHRNRREEKRQERVHEKESIKEQPEARKRLDRLL